MLDELVDQASHSCDLAELRANDSGVTFRAASFLDDYLFRPAALDRLCLFEFVMHNFRRRQPQSVAASALFLRGHPLFGTHCVGTHATEAVPVVSGMCMPCVDAESPADIAIKRSQCALVLFKPFRDTADLVGDTTCSADWIAAYAR